jgi:hypothetical protein
VNQGTTVLKGTFAFDLDTGVQGGSAPGMDICTPFNRWAQDAVRVARSRMRLSCPSGTVNLPKTD